MFSVIKREMANLDLVFNPSNIVIDFESAMLNVLKAHFPNSDLQGCYFHQTQAIWRKVQELGLTTINKDIPEVKRVVRKLMALAFLQILAVRTAFTELRTDPAATEYDLEPLFAYYEHTWLQTFKPALWNVHDKITRTNNHMEGWHNKFSSALGKTHPGVHEFVLALKAEQSATEVTIEWARLGAAPPSRRRKYRELDDCLDRLTKRFKEGESTVNEFLSSVRHIVHHY